MALRTCCKSSAASVLDVCSYADSESALPFLSACVITWIGFSGYEEAP